MSTFTQIIYQIVFSTKNREHTLSKENQKELYKYIWGILNNKKCHLYQIGGITDHVHILAQLHPTIALSTLVKDVKLASANYIENKNLFKNFSGWQNGYGAFTYSINDKNRLIDYIKNQEEHRRLIAFKEEYMEILKEHDIKFEEKFLF